MRKGKRRGGALGGILGLGFPKGVSPNELKAALRMARSAGKKQVELDNTTLDYDKALKILEGYNKMQNFWQGKTADQRSAYIKSHYLSGTTHKPWKNMTQARLRKILSRIRYGYLPGKFIADRADKNFIDLWYNMIKAPKDTRAKMFQAIAKMMVTTHDRGTLTPFKDQQDVAAFMNDVMNLEAQEKYSYTKHGMNKYRNAIQYAPGRVRLFTGKKSAVKKFLNKKNKKKLSAAMLKKIKQNMKRNKGGANDDDDNDDGPDFGIGDAAADIAMPPAAASAAAAAAAAVDPLAHIPDDDALADVLGTDAPPPPPAAAAPSAVQDAFMKGALMAAAKKKRKKAPPKVESHYALRSRKT